MATYPVVMQVIVQLTPLYHAVELLRGITLAQVEWDLVGHTAYLVAVTAVGLVIAARRMRRLLQK